MFDFGAVKRIDFLPDEDSRAWVAEGLREHVTRLGEPARAPRVITEAPVDKPRDLDDLFAMMCAVQAEVGQGDVEFTLLEMAGEDPGIPPGFVPLGDPQGQLMHTFARDDEFLVLVVPAIFRVQALVFASAARELGRMGVHRSGGHQVEADEREADAELAAIALGLGVWVANGAYVYENACCGGGCGIDLKSLRAGLSMPEACFALALDGHRRGLSRRMLSRHLEATQRAALKQNWSYASKGPELHALTAAEPRALT